MNYIHTDELLPESTQQYFIEGEQERQYMDANSRITKPASDKEWKKTVKFAHKKAYEAVEKFEDVVQKKMEHHRKLKQAGRNSTYKIKYVI